ncbi:hypothetical protein EIP86_011239, partial [Pleurotus ostreatoroseus]
MDAFHGEDTFQYIKADITKYKHLLAAEFEAANEGAKANEQLRRMAKDERVRLVTEIRVPVTGQRADIVLAGRPPTEPEDVAKWRPPNANGNLTLSFSNRYFASYKEAKDMENKPFGNGVDPNGVLRDALPKVYHTSDNEVLYYERIVSGDGR